MLPWGSFNSMSKCLVTGLAKVKATSFVPSTGKLVVYTKSPGAKVTFWVSLLNQILLAKDRSRCNTFVGSGMPGSKRGGWIILTVVHKFIRWSCQVLDVQRLDAKYEKAEEQHALEFLFLHENSNLFQYSVIWFNKILNQHLVTNWLCFVC